MIQYMSEELRLMCLCVGIAIIGLAMFLSARPRHGILASLIALVMGGVLGFLIGLIAAFWNTIDGCRSIGDVWHMVKIDHHHALQNRAVLIPVGAFIGMLASWLSLIWLGPLLIRRRAADSGAENDGKV